jgi:hypothetical protein
MGLKPTLTDLKRRSFIRLQNIDRSVNRTSLIALAFKPLIPVSVGRAESHVEDVQVLILRGCGAPGVAISPANAEILMVRLRMIAVQNAFIVFIVFSPIRFFRVKRSIKAVEREGGRPTAEPLNAAHHIDMVTFLQGFLHRG